VTPPVFASVPGSVVVVVLVVVVVVVVVVVEPAAVVVVVVLVGVLVVLVVLLVVVVVGITVDPVAPPWYAPMLHAPAGRGVMPSKSDVNGTGLAERSRPVR
jgi:UPF0716 family protein affecting phage T7 exclusion